MSLSPQLSPRSVYLPPQTGKYKGKKTLIVDLDETLVHYAEVE